jgi:hypothetical protein
MVGRRSWASTARLAGWTVLGILAGLLPVAGFLMWRGWLGAHLGQLVRYSGGHVGWMPVGLPPDFNMLPVLPLLWLGGAGVVLRLAGCRSAEATFAAGERNSLGVLVAFWLAVELAILWAMSKPCLHYYQQIVVPAALAVGLAIGRPWPRSAAAPLAVARAGRWLYVACAALVLRAAMPVVAEASKRAHRFDRQAEIVQFERWMETWSPADAALYGPRKERR